MSIAFVTVLLFYLVLPGILLRRGYLSSRFSIKYISNKFFDEILLAIIPSIIIHTLAINLIRSFSKFEVDLKSVGFLLIGIQDKECMANVLSSIHENFNLIILYSVVLWLFSLGIGHLSRIFVRWRKLDRNYKIFRFSNIWYYLFSGEYLSFPDTPSEEQDIDFIFVDVLVNTSSGQYIYVGILVNYFLSENGGLESIHIIQPSRRKLEEEKYYDIPSDILVIPYKEISNINIRYFSLDEMVSE